MQDIKIQNDEYIPFVMNMVIMCQVCHLITEMVGQNQQIMPERTPIDINPAYTIKQLQDLKVLMTSKADFIQL